MRRFTTKNVNGPHGRGPLRQGRTVRRRVHQQQRRRLQTRRHVPPQRHRHRTAGLQLRRIPQRRAVLRLERAHRRGRAIRRHRQVRAQFQRLQPVQSDGAGDLQGRAVRRGRWLQQRRRVRSQRQGSTPDQTHRHLRATRCRFQLLRAVRSLELPQTPNPKPQKVGKNRIEEIQKKIDNC